MKLYQAILFLLVLTTQLALSQTTDSVKSAVYPWATVPVVKNTTAEQRTLLEGSTRDFSHLKVHATTVPAHEAPHPAHKHADEELIIIKEGQLTVTINGKSKTLGPGSVAMMMPGDTHGFVNNGDQPATYYVMRYNSRQAPDPERGSQAGGSFWIDWNDIAFQPHDKGGIRRYFDRSTTMTKRFEMHATTLNAGLWSHDPHTHRAGEILILLDRSAQTSINGSLFTATTGDLIFLESNVPHAAHNAGQNPCIYLAFQFE